MYNILKVQKYYIGRKNEQGQRRKFKRIYQQTAHCHRWKNCTLFECAIRTLAATICPLILFTLWLFKAQLCSSKLISMFCTVLMCGSTEPKTCSHMVSHSILKQKQNNEGILDDEE